MPGFNPWAAYKLIISWFQKIAFTNFTLYHATAWEIHAYLCRVMYNRRNKFDPLWNSLVIMGCKNGRSFLSTVGMIGQHYEDSHLAAGFGNHMVGRACWHSCCMELPHGACTARLVW